jgi:hypothetical protein
VRDYRIRFSETALRPDGVEEYSHAGSRAFRDNDRRCCGIVDALQAMLFTENLADATYSTGIMEAPLLARKQAGEGSKTTPGAMTTFRR